MRSFKVFNHGIYMIIDNNELNNIGASLKELGIKSFSEVRE